MTQCDARAAEEFVAVGQLIPEDLADIPPGPELARALAGLELCGLSGYDCVEVLKTQSRVVLDEAVLRRMVGGPAAMREQLQHLTEVANLPHVSVLVQPFSAGAHPSIGSAFTLLRFADADTADMSSAFTWKTSRVRSTWNDPATLTATR